MSPRRILRPRQAAERLGLSVRGFYHLVERGEFTLLKFDATDPASPSGVLESEVEAKIDRLVAERAARDAKTKRAKARAAR